MSDILTACLLLAHKARAQGPLGRQNTTISPCYTWNLASKARGSSLLSSGTTYTYPHWVFSLLLLPGNTLSFWNNLQLLNTSELHGLHQMLAFSCYHLSCTATPASSGAYSHIPHYIQRSNIHCHYHNNLFRPHFSTKDPQGKKAEGQIKHHKTVGGGGVPLHEHSCNKRISHNSTTQNSTYLQQDPHTALLACSNCNGARAATAAPTPSRISQVFLNCHVHLSEGKVRSHCLSWTFPWGQESASAASIVIQLLTFPEDKPKLLTHFFLQRWVSNCPTPALRPGVLNLLAPPPRHGTKSSLRSLTASAELSWPQLCQILSTNAHIFKHLPCAPG